MNQPTSSEGSKDQKQQKISETKVSTKSSSDNRMKVPKVNYTSVAIAGILTLILVVIGQLTNISISPNSKTLDPIDSNLVIKHINSLIEIGNSEFVYEKSRAKAREYIRDGLVQGGIPPDQIFWHRFEWSEKKPQGRNITTTTWTGINIVVWTNSTEVPLTAGHEKIRIIGAHYDTNNWGENRTSGAHNNMAGTSMLIELAAKVYRQQQANKDETPYMFVFFDHKEPGSLGSKTFVDYYKVAKHVSQIAYFINVDSIGYRDASPIIQTYPYEDKGTTIFTPKWLAHAMVQSAYAAGDDGMNVGHQSIGQSIRYQAFRYHLISVPLLADEGPFAWIGVPSLLFTDYDIFFDKNADYNEPTDLPQNIDTNAIQKSANILSQFLVSLPTDKITTPAVVTPFNRFFANVGKSFMTTLLNGVEQYLIVGPFAFGFIELASLSLFMLFVVFQVSFASYRDLSKMFMNKPEHTYLTYLNHRVLFFHFVALVIAVCLDTVYAFVVILVAFPALLCISNRRLNVITSIICCIALADFVMSSFVFTVDYGRKGPKARELRLWFLTAIYIAHTFLVLAYGNDYYIKSKFKPKQE